MPFVDFVDLDDVQKIQARTLRPLWTEGELKRFCFWVKAGGILSRRGGHHQLTKAAFADLDRCLRDGMRDPPGKGSLSEWKPGVTFSLTRD